MYVVNIKELKQLPAYVPPVCKELPGQSSGEVLSFNIHVTGRERPLYDFSAVVYDDVQLETVEPPHGAFAQCARMEEQ